MAVTAEMVFAYFVFTVLGLVFVVGIGGWAVGLDDKTAPIPQSFAKDGTLKPTWMECFRALITPTPPKEASAEDKHWEEMRDLQDPAIKIRGGRKKGDTPLGTKLDTQGKTPPPPASADAPATAAADPAISAATATDDASNSQPVEGRGESPSAVSTLSSNLSSVDGGSKNAMRYSKQPSVSKGTPSGKTTPRTTPTNTGSKRTTPKPPRRTLSAADRQESRASKSRLIEARASKATSQAEKQAPYLDRTSQTHEGAAVAPADGEGVGLV